jgi:CIC family chloride channel protein
MTKNESDRGEVSERVHLRSRFRIKRRLEEWFARFTGAEQVPLITLAVVIGSLAGVGSWLFRLLIETLKEGFWGGGFDTTFHFLLGPGALPLWLIVIPPLLGGLLVGPLATLFPAEAKGHGVPEVMESVSRKGGILRPRTVFLRGIASALTIGSGGSAGREGPIVQIGSAIGSWMGQIFNMTERRMKILVGCGAAGGIAATFNAPLAGVLFSLEIILGDFTLRTFSPIVISSAVATAVGRALMGNEPTFLLPVYNLLTGWEFLFYALLGILCGVVARVFIGSLYWAETFFDDRLRLPRILKPALGGLLIGLVGIGYLYLFEGTTEAAFAPMFGNGYGPMGEALVGNMLWTTMLTLAALKILSTSITLGSGGSGGVFAPMLYIGAMVGGAYGSLLHRIFPDITAPGGAYATVGMGAVVAAGAHAPITTILILFELTNEYRIILPILVSCIFATLASRAISTDSIYTRKLLRKGINIEGGRDINVMQALSVRDAMTEEVMPLPESTPFRELLHIVTTSRSPYFPVVDRSGDMTGIISFSDLRDLLFDEALRDLVVAGDIASEPVIRLTPDDNLWTAIEKFSVKDLEQIPVVAAENPRKLLGMISRRDVINAYNREILKRTLED